MWNIKFTVNFIQMVRIGLLSDTHGYLDEKIFHYFKDCNEIWHAGDFGEGVIQKLKEFKKFESFRGVYGNIDGQEIRSIFPEQLVFYCEDVKVMIRHIGGSPPNYNPETRKELALHKPQLFISGHSHILKIIYDNKIDCLHMNPGAAGKQGWQKVRTIIRFAIDEKDIKNCEVIELS
ncbi:MAG TPA: metallophosphoesterase family protein [Chitinophagaceae bacterium]|nr:metallophosphoesterase family protein [Chitinophagaceae bacterium]